MKIAVFDDNKYAVHILEEVIDNFFDTTKSSDYDIFSFTDTRLFCEYYKKNKIDIAFLDIAVKGDSKFGLACAKEIRELNSNAHIVFTTVMEEYMPLSFEGMIRPTHYLVKPFSSEKVFEILEKIMEETCKKKILLKSGAMIYRLNISDILYIVQEKNKMTVYTKTSMINLYKSLKSIYTELEEKFIFADKNVLINPAEIKFFDLKNNRIIMTDEKIIYVSVRRKNLLKKQMEEIV